MRGPLLLILSALLVGFVSANYPLTVIKSCVKESKVKALDLAILYGNQVVPPGLPAKCYMTCVLNDIGLIIDGKLNTNLLMMTADQNKAGGFMTKVAHTCKDIESSEECEIGYLLYKCMRDLGQNTIYSTPTEGDAPKDT